MRPRKKQPAIKIDIPDLVYGFTAFAAFLAGYKAGYEVGQRDVKKRVREALK